MLTRQNTMGATRRFYCPLIFCLFQGFSLSCGQRHAVCYMISDPYSGQPVDGTVKFSQAGADLPLNIDINLTGFDPVPAGSLSSDLDHGIHVHQYGDITKGCISTGGHFYPSGVYHGGPSDTVRHAGDFGNHQQSPDGKMVTSFTDKVATLYGEKSIIGRAIVVHAGQDDLGRGGDAGSLVNGNAGPRLGCCVIGLAKD